MGHATKAPKGFPATGATRVQSTKADAAECLLNGPFIIIPCYSMVINSDYIAIYSDEQGFCLVMTGFSPHAR